MKFTYLYVSLESYNDYVTKYGNNRLDKWIKVLPPSSKSFVLNNYSDYILEAFEGIGRHGCQRPPPPKPHSLS